MELYGYLIVLLIIVAFIALLPLISGVGGFNKGDGTTEGKNKATINFKLKEDQDNKGKSSTFANSHKFAVDNKTGLKRRVIGKYDNDPNSFDYDLNELIDEDANEERKIQEDRYASFKGKEEELYDELA
ncbi:similar to Saccharomyces cerevisiae YDL121C Putative protein of unknown function [Maudiozyma barnettii]|uniref:Uncharacterized protein n=1 Tax=Maudiozyma barnettii TaxID=61262 RepID=A0A8H2ZKK3_9SACH|nr:Exp1p [Kazachstania barnettii]CAB4257058.1 similar to Saccharomyces cerevisiae YDL121C Putative protein of unknown function [Kazachstania barnettii]CAD1779429.1 similar to Saccharomyces cerevisiae YDL121C Putative protein of unknown function [Kazachstania barnettii]